MKKIQRPHLSAGFLAIFSLLALPACSQSGSHNDQASATAIQVTSPEELEGLSKAYFASGCFWCVEAVYESVSGVKEVVSGYAGGEEPNPTYRQVSNGLTGHAEAVEVYYDSTVVDFPTLVNVYYGSHDPTSVNRQGPDRGTQYRSIAFYRNETEKQIIDAYIRQLYDEGEYQQGEIVTEVTMLETFWPAEDYHQNYERKNPNNPYVRGVSIPRLRRFQKNYPELLKTDIHK